MRRLWCWVVGHRWNVGKSERVRVSLRTRGGQFTDVPADLYTCVDCGAQRRP